MQSFSTKQLLPKKIKRFKEHFFIFSNSLDDLLDADTVWQERSKDFKCVVSQSSSPEVDGVKAVQLGPALFENIHHRLVDLPASHVHIRNSILLFGVIHLHLNTWHKVLELVLGYVCARWRLNICGDY